MRGEEIQQVLLEGVKRQSVLPMGEHQAQMVLLLLINQLPVATTPRVVVKKMTKI